MADTTITTKCCIAGGGPAGMMLGFLLARAGVAVVVLEKHPDFFRDFRGDTVHPSTLELMCELGLIDEFLKLPHQKVETLTGQVGAERLKLIDFRHVPTRCKFIALMPQWDFLNFLAQQRTRRYAGRFAFYKYVCRGRRTGCTVPRSRRRRAAIFADLWPADAIVSEMTSTSFTDVEAERRHLRRERDLAELWSAVGSASGTHNCCHHRTLRTRAAWRPSNATSTIRRRPGRARRPLCSSRWAETL